MVGVRHKVGSQLARQYSAHDGTARLQGAALLETTKTPGNGVARTLDGGRTRRAGAGAEHGKLFAQCERLASQLMHASWLAAGACIGGGALADWWIRTDAPESAAASAAASWLPF